MLHGMYVKKSENSTYACVCPWGPYSIPQIKKPFPKIKPIKQLEKFPEIDLNPTYIPSLLQLKDRLETFISSTNPYIREKCRCFNKLITHGYLSAI
jgi:hypothetical protein